MLRRSRARGKVSSGSSENLIRLIPTLTGTQYGTIDTAITFTGDFEVEAQFSTTADTVAIFGKSTDDASLCFLTGAGLLQARFANVTGINSTTVVNDGKIHTALMRRVGTTNTLFIDGVQENTNTQAVVNAVFDLIGTSSGSLLFNGEILSVKFTDNSGTPVVTNFVFDSGSDLYQLPRGESLGSQLWDDSPSTVESGWTDNGDGSYTCDGTNNVSVIEATLDLHDTKNYLVTYTVSLYTSGAFRVLLYGEDDVAVGADRTATGTYSEVINIDTATAGGASRLLLYSPTSFNGTVSNISVQQLPDNACLLTAFVSSTWNRYTLQRNITHDAGTIAEAWVGDNVVVNGTFDADTDWTKNGVNIAITGGECVWGSGSIAGDHILQDISGVADSIYLAGVAINAYTSGDAKIRIGATGEFPLGATGVGQHKVVVTASGSDLKVIATGGTPLFTLDNVSAQKLLEVA